MPWHVAQTAKCPASKPWAVIKDSDGSVEGCHPTKADAEKQMAALYSNEPGAKSMTRTRQQPRDSTGWYRISAQADGPAQIMLYDLIGAWGVTAKDFLRDLAAVGDGPVEVHLASDGGDVFEAYAIYTALAARPGVTTIVDSIAASSASVIAMAGERRLMAKLSQMMVHDAWAGIDGNADDLQHMIGRLNTVSEQIASVYADTAGGTAEHWRGLMKAETWFTPQQALDAGLITGITETAREPATAAAARVPEGAGIVAAGVTPDAVAAAVNASGPQDANVDESAWDASKAWAAGAASDDPAAFYNAICAGKKAGDPATQAAHALPHHYHPGDPPNRHGVSAALGRLPGTDGLTNKQAAEAHLKSHQSAMGSGGQAAAQATEGTHPDYEPAGQAASAATSEGKPGMEDDVLTIEGRRSRIEEIKARCQELHNQYPSALYPADVQSEWDKLVAERRSHQAALDSVDQRSAELGEMYAREAGSVNGGAATPAGGPRFESVATQQGQQRPQAPAVHVSKDIYDLADIRQQARSIDDMPRLYRNYARRVVDVAQFPGTARETAQANVSRLLDELPDDPHGTVARRVIATGNPEYSRVFGRALLAGTPGALSGRDAQILALGMDDTGAFAVPFELDPTMILTSDYVVNPLRQIADVRQIAGKELDLVTAGAVTVTRGAERAEAPDSTPVLAQPAVRVERVSGTVKFTVELEGDWTGLQSSMSTLLRDAKDVEEASSFTLGTGVAPAAGGIIGTLAAGSNVTATGAAGAGIAITDFAALDNALPPRFRARAVLMAARAQFNAARLLFMAEPGEAAIPWATPGTAGPDTYPAYENSLMSTASIAGTKAVLFGDVKAGFAIVDRVGMAMELVPHVLGANGRPTGERLYFTWWRNNSVIKTSNALRVLVLH